jgi:undecaprenyl diphosphate synthase
LAAEQEADTPGGVPRHVAIVMDGNGRWAEQRRLARVEGHRRGGQAARATIRHCAEAGVQALTLFAFSSENWRRPKSEVSALMGLFRSMLESERDNLRDEGVRFRVIGDRSGLDEALVEQIERTEAETRDNRRLDLVLAANYGGRWDISAAARQIAAEAVRGELDPEAVGEAELAARLSLADLPEPDLFIRTAGERRISNFLLWQLAYTELYFSDTLWPDFGQEALDTALADYGSRQRRFGLTGEQIEGQSHGA